MPAEKPAWRLHWEITLLLAGEAGAIAFLVVYYVLFVPEPVESSLVIPGLIPLLPMLLRIVLSACVGLVSLRIDVQEAVMAWYGGNLVNAAYASAEKIAGGANYCVIDREEARRFEELDRRGILQDAVVKRIGFRGMNTTWVSAHFGIAVDDRAYWWSFRHREFLPFPRGRDSMLYSRACPYSQ